jgi:hypothetical protein
VLSGGRHVAKVLVLYPLTSIWTNYVPQSRTEVGNLIEAEFTYLTDTLLRLHYDFDYVDEDVLAQAAVADGRISIREEHYDVFILPPVTHLRTTTFDLLERFAGNGGHLIADTLLPSELLEAESNGVAGRVKRLFGVSADELERSFREDASDRVSALRAARKKGSVTVFRGKGLHRARAKELLRKTLTRCVPPDVAVNEEDVFYLHRLKDGYDLYYLVNTARAPRPGVEVSFERVGVPELWNLSSGAMGVMPEYRIRKGRLTINLDFAPGEAHVVSIREETPGPHVVDSTLHVESFDGSAVRGYMRNGVREAAVTVVSGRKTARLRTRVRKPLKPILLPARWTFTREGDNALLLTKWRMLPGGQAEPGPEVAQPAFDDSAWLEVRNGAWEMQLPQERDSQVYPVTLWYRTYFETTFVPPDLRVLIDGFRGSTHRLFVNGNEVRDRGKRSRLDAEINEVNISGFTVPGRNCIAVQLTVTRRTDGILDPLKLVGRFELTKAPSGHSLVEPAARIRVGDWTKQGYPFFSGTGIYGAEFKVPRGHTDGKLFLEVSCGEDVLEVRLNEGTPVVIPWPPYRLDVTDMVKPGANTVELKITNTLINLLEGVEHPSGLRARPVITHFHRYTLVAE